MWRSVAMILVVLTALYNIMLYAGILEKNIKPHTRAAEPMAPLERSKESLATNTNDIRKFFLIPTPEMTSNLLLQQNASAYYESALNEESAEVWLHRGFEKMSDARTLDPTEADVFLIAGYLHLAKWNIKSKKYVSQTLLKRIHNKTMPHVILCPTWNPETSRKSGIAPLIQQLQSEGINVWSVGLERNPSWQILPPERIIPVPYVVRPSFPRNELLQKASSPRKENFVFYAGDRRQHAIEWAGCNRSMILPLQNATNMDVSIRTPDNRLSQEDYNTRMFTSDYCLILCGDTVTSRSLTSAVVYGCLPVRVGSRLRGLCEAPCHEGWGWSVTGEQYPHLPFSSFMEWQGYPEVKEQEFSEQPLKTLQQMFQTFTSKTKSRIRGNMLQHQLGWIYGWGDPVTSDDFGEATEYVWQSILTTLGL